MTTYFVSLSGGNDANDGLTEGTAFKTLGFASGQLSAGDSLFLKRGDTWTGADEGNPIEAILEIAVSNILVDAYDSGARPIIDRSAETDPSPDAINPDVTCVRFQSGGSSSTIKNIELIGARNTAAILNLASSTTVDNCVLSGAGWPSESLIVNRQTNFIMQDCVSDAIVGNSDGYDKHVENRANGAIIRRSTFRGFQIGGGLRWSNGATNGIIERCFIFDPDQRNESNCWGSVQRSGGGGTHKIINCVYSLVGSTLSGASLRGPTFFLDSAVTPKILINNTIISDARGYGVHGSTLQGGASSICNNNIFYDLQTGWNNIGTNTCDFDSNNFFSTPNHYTDQAPGTEVNSSTYDPGLVNPSMSNTVPEDCKLTTGSSAINDGTNAHADTPTDDFGGTARSGNNDLGAWEFSGSDPFFSRSDALSIAESVILEPDIIELVTAEAVSTSEDVTPQISAIEINQFDSIAVSEFKATGITPDTQTPRVLIFPSPFV